MAPLTKLVELEHDQQLAELVESWDFSRGKSFQNMVLADLGAPVHHPSSSPAGSFSLLAVFRRYTFRLTEDSVSLALHACLGGAPAGFHVTYIQDRHFRFVVSCKQVGFKVCDLKRVITEHFDVYFHLWRDGGARWIGELKRWNREEEAGWTKVTRKKGKKYGKRVSFSNKIAQDSPVKLSRPPELEETNPSSRPTWTIQFGSFSYQVQVEDPQAEPVGQENQSDQFAGSSIEDGDSQNVIHGAEAIRRLKVDEAVQIPVYRVYSKLRRDLRIDGVGGSGSSSEAHTPTQPPLSANRWKGCRVSDRGNVACFKCLGLGHFVRDCREEIRCFFCFNYGHRARECRQRKFSLSRSWAPKPINPERPTPSFEVHAANSFNASNASSFFCKSSAIRSDIPPSQPEIISTPVSSPVHQPLEHFSPSTSTLSEGERRVDMNFAINPAPYIPVGMVEEYGGPGRRVRTTVCLGVPAVKRHEEYAIATTEDALTPAQRLALLHEISHYVTTVMRKEIATYSIHPHGVGIYKFRNSCERDILVHTSPHQVGPHTVTFVNHDAAMNCKRSPFNRIGWILLLGYPLDYKEKQYIDKACSPFAQVVHWHATDYSLSRVLVKVLFEDLLEIPRSLKLKAGRTIDGEGRSWTVPVYILNNEFADMMPDEEIPPPPNNGNPHPHEGPVAHGEPEQVAEWAENQMNQQGFGEWPIGDDQDDQN